MTSTLADGVPGATGRLSASTSSAMHMSLAKRSTVSPGSLWPTSPSVEANVSSGRHAESVGDRRTMLGADCSLVDVTPSGAIVRRPAIRSAASCASVAG